MLRFETQPNKLRGVDLPFKQEVLVPMVHYDLSLSQIQGSQAEGNENLGIIKQFSPLKEDKDFQDHFKKIGDHGTRVIIWTLRHEEIEEQLPDGGVNTSRYCEFDFSNPKDICIRDFSKEKPKDKRSRPPFFFFFFFFFFLEITPLFCHTDTGAQIKWVLHCDPTSPSCISHQEW